MAIIIGRKKRNWPIEKWTLPKHKTGKRIGKFKSQYKGVINQKTRHPNKPLSQYKKVAEDDRSATLEHPLGHKIMIAKNVLSPKFKADLQKLPRFASIWYQKKSIRLGNFKTELEAAKAYDATAKKLFGANTYLNFSD